MSAVSLRNTNSLEFPAPAELFVIPVCEDRGAPLLLPQGPEGGLVLGLVVVRLQRHRAVPLLRPLLAGHRGHLLRSLL